MSSVYDALAPPTPNFPASASSICWLSGCAISPESSRISSTSLCITSSGARSTVPGQIIAGYNLSQMLTYVSVGWIIRSFYWNTIDQEMAYEVIEGKIAMDLIKPVSMQWMWISRAMGESAFRLGLLTVPVAIVVALVFPVQGPSSRQNFALFLVGVLGSFFLMGAINFMIGTCAIPLQSILALIRAKFWLIELLSGLLIPMSFSRSRVQRVLAWLPFEHIAYTPLQIYLGKLDHAAGVARARHSMVLGHRAAAAGASVVESRRRAKSRSTED